MKGKTKKVLLGLGIGTAALLAPLCVCVDEMTKETMVESLLVKLKTRRDANDESRRTITVEVPGLLLPHNWKEARQMAKEAMESVDLDPEEMLGTDMPPEEKPEGPETPQSAGDEGTEEAAEEAPQSAENAQEPEA